MAKRSAFERRAGDAYPTPIEAVLPLIPHLRACATSPTLRERWCARTPSRILRPVLHLCR